MSENNKEIGCNDWNILVVRKNSREVAEALKMVKNEDHCSLFVNVRGILAIGDNKILMPDVNGVFYDVDKNLLILLTHTGSVSTDQILDYLGNNNISCAKRIFNPFPFDPAINSSLEIDIAGDDEMLSETLIRNRMKGKRPHANYYSELNGTINFEYQDEGQTKRLFKSEINSGLVAPQFDGIILLQSQLVFLVNEALLNVNNVQQILREQGFSFASRGNDIPQCLKENDRTR